MGASRLMKGTDTSRHPNWREIRISQAAKDSFVPVHLTLSADDARRVSGSPHHPVYILATALNVLCLCRVTLFPSTDLATCVLRIDLFSKFTKRSCAQVISHHRSLKSCRGSASSDLPTTRHLTPNQVQPSCNGSHSREEDNVRRRILRR